MATILIVDDSNLSRKTCRRILEAGGYHVRDAADGMSALEQYALDRPDLVLLDVTMADMNGLEVLRQLRAIDAGARVVMATADVQSSTWREPGGRLGLSPSRSMKRRFWQPWLPPWRESRNDA